MYLDTKIVCVNKHHAEAVADRKHKGAQSPASNPQLPVTKWKEPSDEYR